jgi:hypothetical protein
MGRFRRIDTDPIHRQPDWDKRLWEWTIFCQYQNRMETNALALPTWLGWLLHCGVIYQIICVLLLSPNPYDSP